MNSMTTNPGDQSKKMACAILGHDWHRQGDICMRCGEPGDRWGKRRLELIKTEKYKAVAEKIREITEGIKLP